MDGNKDGKSKSNKESILRNWKTLKQCIEPLDFVRELQRCNFLPKSSFEHLGSKSRSHQATLVLIKVYRKVQSSKKEYQKFVEILRRYNSTAADALTNPVRGPINTGIVDKHPIEQTRELLKRFEKLIKDKLKRHPDVVLDIIDNFIGYGLLDIDTVEQILHSPMESHERLVEFVITNNLPGTYNLMLETLKSEKKLKGLVSGSSTAAKQETRRDFPDDTRVKQETRRDFPDDTRAEQETRRGFCDVRRVKEYIMKVYREARRAKQETRRDSPDVRRDNQETRRDSPVVRRETADEFTLSINGKHKNPEMNSAPLPLRSLVDIGVFEYTSSTREKEKEGSTMVGFKKNCSKICIALNYKTQQEAMTQTSNEYSEHLMNRICQNNKIRNMKTAKQVSETSSMPPDFPSATLLSRIARTQSEQQTTESVQQTAEYVQHAMNQTVIAANRSFLIEEINTMALVRAFQDKGITCFDGLDGTLGRQQMAEYFLTILEKKNNLLDQLLVILREQGMTYVLNRLINCRNAYSADPQILRRNIFNNRTDILDNLDIEDVREIFVEREVFSSSMFDEIEKKKSQSEDQMSAVLNIIINSGSPAMRILVDALYINHVDLVADNLLRGAPNVLQEM